MCIKIILWSLLFVIPGIIAAISYSQSWFLLNENPKMKINEILTKSSQMMNGHKWEFLIMQFSFLGWAFLLIFVASLSAVLLLSPPEPPAITSSTDYYYMTTVVVIGLLWIKSYAMTSFANYYLALKKENK